MRHFLLNAVRNASMEQKGHAHCPQALSKRQAVIVSSRKSETAASISVSSTNLKACPTLNARPTIFAPASTRSLANVHGDDWLILHDKY